MVLCFVLIQVEGGGIKGRARQVLCENDVEVFQSRGFRMEDAANYCGVRSLGPMAQGLCGLHLEVPRYV